MNERFRSIEGRSKLVIAALTAAIACDLFAIWVDVREIQLMNRILDSDTPELSELDASDDRQAIAGSLVLLTLVVTAVVFLVWFSRAFKNLAALGATDLRYGTGWAIGAWFVPFLNLWRPKQIANDIWRASDPGAPRDQGNSWRPKPVSNLLLGWWIVWIVSLYAGNLSARLYFSGDEAEDIRNADYADVVALMMDIGAAVLAVAVVFQMTRRQSARARNIADEFRPEPQTSEAS